VDHQVQELAGFRLKFVGLYGWHSGTSLEKLTL
jgi:hypothetical protein